MALPVGKIAAGTLVLVAAFAGAYFVDARAAAGRRR